MTSGQKKHSKAIEAASTGDNRPARYMETDEDGEPVAVYRASSLGGCLRAFVAMARGEYAEPTSDEMLEIFGEGHLTEPLIRERYEQETGYEVTVDRDPAELYLGKINGTHVVVRGSNDGIVQLSGNGTEDRRLFEAKKFRESTWPKFQQQGVECNKNYPWQVSAYMYANGLDECDFVGGRITTDDWGEITLHEIEVKHLAQPPIPLAAIRKRVLAIEKVVQEGFAPGEVECDLSQYPCPYFRLHDDRDEDALDLGRFGEQATAFLADFYQAGVDEKAAKERKRRADKALRELLGEDGLAAAKLTHPDYKISHVKKVVKEHTRKESTQDYFTVKPVDGAQDTAQGEGEDK